jgi:hypothetical protein
MLGTPGFPLARSETTPGLARGVPRAITCPSDQPCRGAGNNRAVSTATASSFLNTAGKAQDSYSYGEPQSSRAGSPVDGEMVKGGKLVLISGLGIDPQGVDAGVAADLGDGDPSTEAVSTRRRPQPIHPGQNTVGGSP